jgi:DnaJ-class molecular chaperone
MSARQCPFTKSDGNLCSAAPLRDSDYCLMHDVSSAARVTQARLRGGRNRGKGSRQKLALPAADLFSTDGSLQFLQDAARAATTDGHDLSLLRVARATASTAMRLNEQRDREQRKREAGAAGSWSLRGQSASNATGSEPADEPPEATIEAVTITLAEALTGTRVAVELCYQEGPCMLCAGHGELVGEQCPQCGGTGIAPLVGTYGIPLPPGVLEGQKFRLPQQGAVDPESGERGDRCLVVSVAPHPQYRRDGNDLRVSIDVPIEVAVLGGSIPLTVLDGSVESIIIPPGTLRGGSVRLAGHGMPHAGGCGDLLVALQLVVSPATLGVLRAIFGPTRGEDIVEPITLTLEEAHRGVRLQREVRAAYGGCEHRRMEASADACDQCKATEVVELALKPGVDAGHTLRFERRGAPGQHGGPPGDHLFVVQLSAHDSLRRLGDDLFAAVSVPIEAAIGTGRVKYPTLAHGEQSARLLPDTQGEQVVVVPGEGMPRPGGGCGDLYLQLHLVWTRESRDIIRRWQPTIPSSEASLQRADPRWMERLRPPTPPTGGHFFDVQQPGREELSMGTTGLASPGGPPTKGS